MNRSLSNRLLLAAALFAAVPIAARADITAVKTCVDRNGGGICKDDWIDCTVAVSVTGAMEDFNITDQIPGSFYRLWRFVTTPPGAVDCSNLQNVAMLSSQTGRYCWSRVMMNPGASFDFRYEAQVRNDRCFNIGDQTCGLATFRNTNLEQFESNVECVIYSCPASGPSLTATKTWTGPSPVVVGAPVTFTIVVSNVGTAADTNVNLRDTVDATRFSQPTNIVMTPAPNLGGFTNYTLDATWNTLAAGANITISFDTVYANCATSGLDGPCNQAEVRSASITTGCATTGFIRTDNPATPSFGDATCRNATAGGSAMIVSPPMKTMTNLDGPVLDIGDRLRITVTFQNNAPCGASFGRFEDPLPVSLTYVAPTTVTPASGTPSFNAPTNTVIVDNFAVAGNGTTTITFDVTVNALPGGPICNTGKYRFGVSNLIDTTQACVGRVDTLAISKSHNDPNGNGTVLRGQIFEYWIDVLNNGTAAVPDGLVTDTIPACFNVLSILDAAGGNGNIAGQTVTVSALPIPLGASPTRIRIQVQENGTCALGQSPCNVATLSSSGTPTPIVSNDACLTIEASDVTATKSHSDPNMNGRIQPGQTFDYTIAVRNNSASPLNDLSVSDTIPSCFDVLAVTNAGGGSPMIVGQLVTVTMIPVNAAASKDITIQVMENGSCAIGTIPCNNADVTSSALPFPLRTNDACIEISESCALSPGVIRPLFAVKRAPAVELSWTADANAADGYNLYSVLDKTLIPNANALGSPPAVLECFTTAQATIICSDPDGLTVSDPRLYYQVLGVCGGLEGAQ